MIRPLTALVATALALLVTAPLPATSLPAGSRLPDLVATEPPAVEGMARQGETLRAFPGRWTPDRQETRYQWLRDGEPIRGAKERRYRLAAVDVGTRISVRVRVRAPGHAWTAADSERTRRVAHSTPVRRRVTYSVTTKGRITTSVEEFARLAQETYDDARGWRAGGVRFRRVPRGGHFTLVLSEARLVPSYSSTCSVTWSCRVGRYVIINQDRWKHASPAWNDARQTLRGYRHLVVNHETGHWLGRGHTGCPGSGPAPVMMPQSKGTGRCTFNPWPLPWER